MDQTPETTTTRRPGPDVSRLREHAGKARPRPGSPLADPSHAAIDNDAVLATDLGISQAPPDSPCGPPRPADSDFQVYIPQQQNQHDSCNQHFLVVPCGNGDFLGTWTTGSLEGADNQHLVTAHSSDRGRTWTAPRYLAGPETDGHIASWGVPFVVPETGRVYLFYNQHRGYIDFHHQWTGQLWFKVSDDHGRTWSEPYTHLGIEPDGYSHADPEADPNWIAYQPPMITTQGTVLVGFTQIGTQRLAVDGEFPSEVRFLRFDNILTERDPARLRVSTLPENGGDGLRLPDPRNPRLSMLQEPSIQCLGDGRLFCVMRTATGYIAYAVSADEGRTWTRPQLLRNRDGGDAIPHPISPCPLYKLQDGRFLLLHHNNSGDANHGRHVADWCRNRRPIFVSVGREVVPPRPDGQPIAFDAPVVLADNDRVPISRKQLTEIGTYPSIFEYGGAVYFFFPDRKHYLLGKVLGDDLLNAAASK